MNRVRSDFIEEYPLNLWIENKAKQSYLSFSFFPFLLGGFS